ncbi:hypothetical protein [Kordiimonas sp.]|uniref:hypothetical protein n=1 Tax=Kordiimonas sp. TaxID=1970157 RepID=UPI003A8FC077
MKLWLTRGAQWKQCAPVVRLADRVPGILPQGKRMAREWVAFNPTRSDRSSGSFRINLNSGAWADLATDD